MVGLTRDKKQVAFEAQLKHNRSQGQRRFRASSRGIALQRIWMYRTGPGDAIARCRPERRPNLSLNCA